MSGKQMPTVDVTRSSAAHMARDLSGHLLWGGRLYPAPPFHDAKSAMKQYQTTHGALSTAEKRSFMAGWRYQMLAFQLERLRDLGSLRLSAKAVELMTQEVQALADRYETFIANDKESP